MELYFFYAFAALCVIGALMILFFKNVLYSAFSLMLTFLGIAAIYVFLHADFVAVTQIVVYVGGVLVLLVFGIMFTHKSGSQGLVSGMKNQFWGILLSVGFSILFIYLILTSQISSTPWIQAAPANELKTTVSSIGILLMSQYVLAFELAAILLLLALIGATFIAARDEKIK